MHAYHVGELNRRTFDAFFILEDDSWRETYRKAVQNHINQVFRHYGYISVSQVIDSLGLEDSEVLSDEIGYGKTDDNDYLELEFIPRWAPSSGVLEGIDVIVNYIDC